MKAEQKGYIDQTRNEIIEAYLFLRKHNHTIPSETLQFMLDASKEKLEALSLLSNKESEEEKECIEILKAKLEVNAGRLVEPILKEGKNPKDDSECHKAFLALSHLQLIEEYLTSKD